jgi:hypothetical protein
MIEEEEKRGKEPIEFLQNKHPDSHTMFTRLSVALYAETTDNGGSYSSFVTWISLLAVSLWNPYATTLMVCFPMVFAVQL